MVVGEIERGAATIVFAAKVPPSSAEAEGIGGWYSADANWAAEASAPAGKISPQSTSTAKTNQGCKAVRLTARAVRSTVQAQIDLKPTFGMPVNDYVNYRPNGMEIRPPGERVRVREARSEYNTLHIRTGKVHEQSELHDLGHVAANGGTSDESILGRTPTLLVVTTCSPHQPGPKLLTHGTIQRGIATSTKPLGPGYGNSPAPGACFRMSSIAS